MPRDVRTRWNSTFDMLDFAVEHRDTFDIITGDRDMKLRQYELSEEDWAIAIQLRDVLKVSFTSWCRFLTNPDFYYTDLQGRDTLLLATHSKHCCCDPGHGSHR